MDRPKNTVRHCLSGITTVDRVSFKRRTLHDLNDACDIPHIPACPHVRDSPRAEMHVHVKN